MNKFAGTLLALGLAGAAMNAHALCVKPNGSLDDPSVPPGAVVMDMVPPCDAATTSAAGQPGAVLNDGQPMTSQAGNASQPKRDGKS